jgi:hypothetical protein
LPIYGLQRSVQRSQVTPLSLGIEVGPGHEAHGLLQCVVFKCQHELPGLDGRHEQAFVFINAA